VRKYANHTLIIKMELFRLIQMKTVSGEAPEHPVASRKSGQSDEPSKQMRI